MKPLLAGLLVVMLGASVAAQDSAKPSSRAAIEGIVTKDPDSQPVKKAVIELIAENQTEGGDYTAVTRVDGSFRIENILPGRYHLFIERPGFLDSSKSRWRPEGRVLVLAAGQELKDLIMRLQAAAVVRGRVTDEDGDPLADADVTVLRQTFASGRSHWEQAGAERTNDLGEFRIANLPAGSFYVSVSPPPDFKSLIEAAGVAASEPRNTEKAGTSYQTTFYPGTTDRSQAAPIQLHAGDDFPVNFSLTPSPAVSIRGSVVNLPPHTSATIMLQSRELGVVMNGADMHKDGSFVIRDVSPGNYTIVATVDGSAVPMTARQSLQVGSSGIEGLRLAPQPGATLRGHLRMETGESARHFDPEHIFLSLQPEDSEELSPTFLAPESALSLVHVMQDGSFEWSDLPPGSYYVLLTGNNGADLDCFVKSVLMEGREVNDSGITVNGGTVILDVIASMNGAIVDGMVSDAKGQPVANAVVVAVPEGRMRRRPDRYGKTVSDQSGRFSLHGIRPGSYTLFAWESIDGEAYYDPEFLKSYEGQGSGLRIGEGEHKRVPLQAILGAEVEE